MHQRNYLENEFRYAKNVTGIDIEWERDRVTLMYDNEKDSEQVHWEYTLDEESMKLLFKIGSEMDKTVSVSLDVKNTSELYTFCIDGFIKDKDLGYCLNLHHSDTKHGIVVKMKEPKDEFGFFEDGNIYFEAFFCLFVFCLFLDFRKIKFELLLFFP